MVETSAITNFDVATAAIFAWLVPSIINRIRLYHRSIDRSSDAVIRYMAAAAAAASKEEEEGEEEDEGGRDLRVGHHRTVKQGLLRGLLFGSTIYIVTAITLALVTRDLDMRASYILVGLSNFTGAFFIFFLSYSAPEWMGIYHSIYDNIRRTELGHSLPSLKFKVTLSVLRICFKVYPVLFPYFMGVRPATIPVSALTGIIAGFLLCRSIDYINRSDFVERSKRLLAVSIAVLLMLASAWLFAYGCGYVEEVWADDPDTKHAIDTVEGISFLCWIAAALCMHFIVYGMTHRMAKSGASEDVVVRRPRTFFGASVYTSTMNFSRHNFSNPFFALGRHSLLHNNRDSEAALERKQLEKIQQELKLEQQVHNNDNGGQGEEKEKEDNEEEETTEQTQSFSTVDEATIKDPISPSEQPVTNNKHDNGTEDHPQDTNNTEDLLMVDDEMMIEDTTCSLLNVGCCGHNCGPAGREKPCSNKCYNCCKWTGWVLLLFLSAFFVAVLVGAQQQDKEVRKLLPRVYDILYDHMNEGPVCAYDDRNESLPLRTRVESTQRSFDSDEEAHLAGYSILHCGACAACSNWPDLRIEYTTREILGQVALDCALKVLVGGGFEKLLQCTMDKTGFERDCAECWTQDYLCVKENCRFIAMRAFIVNTVSNLQVGPNDVTPSTCEEAFCEATEITGYVGFVPCSGASRRRMNVESSIERPKNQQCNIVDVTPWENFFGYSSGHGDYIEGWGETLD